MTEFPIAFYGHRPHPLAVHIGGTRLDGVPDGIHTGGAWLMPSGEVWKPLFARPHPTARALYATHELQALQALAEAGVPLFPANWREERIEVDGYTLPYLVRPKCRVYGSTAPIGDITTADLLRVEQAVLHANRLEWEIGDAISLALDPDQGLFILDLSCAQRMTGVGAFAADDRWRVERLFRDLGRDDLTELRRLACERLAYARLYHESNPWVAAKRPVIYRALQALEIPGAYTEQADQPGVGWWVLNDGPIDQRLLAECAGALEYVWERRIVE